MKYTYDDLKNDYDKEEDYFEHEGEDVFLYALIAAFSGNVQNMRSMGDVYSSKGRGVKVDYDKALFWYEKAAEAGDSYSALQAADLYSLSDEIPHDYKKAYSFYMKAAGNGGAYATARLGVFYKYGVGIEANEKAAEQLLEYAAKNGERIGEYEYALILKAEGQSDEVWLGYMEKAAKKSYAPASVYLIEYYKTVNDLQSVAEYTRLAAYAGDMNSQLAAAEMHLKGDRLKRSKDMAIYFYRLAAEQGSKEAEEKLKQLTGG